MNDVQVTISSAWPRRISSPLGTIVYGLSGVSVTFAPFLLYRYGQGHHTLGPPWIGIPIILAIMLLPTFFHVRLSSHIAEQLKTTAIEASSNQAL